MSATVTRLDGPAGRFYDVNGNRYPSVTHILSAIAKPALVPWAAKVEREAVSAAAADLYAQWAGQTLVPALPRAAYLATLHAQLGPVRAHQKALEKAGNIGSDCHRLIEWTMRRAVGAIAGPQPRVGDEAQRAFTAFTEWARDVSLKPLVIERTVYSTAHGYAGTMDLLARVRGVLTLVDFKTSKAVYPESFLQSAAYHTAVREMGYRELGGAIVVRLPKLDTDPPFQVVEVPPVADLFPVFLAVKQLWQWSYANEAAYRARRAS